MTSREVNNSSQNVFFTGSSQEVSRRTSKQASDFLDGCKDSEKAKRSFMVTELSTTYILLTSSFVLACSLYYTVTRVHRSGVYFYEILFVILYLTGIAVLIYLFVFISRTRYKSIPRDSSQIDNENVGLRLSKQDVNRSASTYLPCISFNGEGFNAYLRIGLTGFNFFACVYNLIRIISEGMDNFEKCGHVAYMIAVFLQGVFFTVQTVFILLNHKIIFLSNKPLIRLLLAHLLIVNICSWIHSGLSEISEGVAEVLNREREDARRAKLGEKAGENVTRACEQPISPAALTRPYLSPAIIEYVLLTIPMTLELLWRVGDVEAASKVEEKEEENEEFPLLHKSKRGLIAGVVAMVVSITSVLGFFFLSSSFPVVGLALYHSEAFVLNLLAFLFCALCYHHLSKLKFMRESEYRLDEMILRLALFGTFFYYIIIISNSIDSYDPESAQERRIFTMTEIILAIVTTIAVCFQAFVIISGLHRAPAVRDHVVRKPGRPYVTVLLCINLALWMIDTFQVKKSEMAFSVTQTKGNINVVTSVALMHVALPMVILFRFQSSVCLSFIWYKSYLLE